jgi:hypothetical protein
VSGTTVLVLMGRCMLESNDDVGGNSDVR